MSDAQKSRKKRIVRRMVLTIAIPMLLLSGYVSSYFALVWASHRDYLPEWYLLVAYEPLKAYQRSNWVGSREFRAVKYWAMNSSKDFAKAYEQQIRREEARKSE